MGVFGWVGLGVEGGGGGGGEGWGGGGRGRRWWKEANVTPVHKKNDKQPEFQINCPISLLPITAKVFQRIIFKNLYNYLISNNRIT